VLRTDTFEEMLEKIHDKDFILKVIQAGVVLCKSKPLASEMVSGSPTFLKRVVDENEHNDLEEKHYLAFIDLFYYEAAKDFSDLNKDNPAMFPNLTRYF
jgi:hypothetical protein